MADTKLKKVIVNVGTLEQILAGIAGGTITADQFSLALDGPEYLTTDDIVSSVSAFSTNFKAVGAKLFYDTCGDIEALINDL